MAKKSNAKHVTKPKPVLIDWNRPIEWRDSEGVIRPATLLGRVPKQKNGLCAAFWFMNADKTIIINQCRADGTFPNTEAEDVGPRIINAEPTRTNYVALYSRNCDGELQTGESWDSEAGCRKHSMDNSIATLKISCRGNDLPTVQVLPVE